MLRRGLEDLRTGFEAVIEREKLVVVTAVDAIVGTGAERAV